MGKVVLAIVAVVSLASLLVAVSTHLRIRSPDGPPGAPPEVIEARFCCGAVDGSGKGAGTGCEEIVDTPVAGNLCITGGKKVLRCSGGHTQDGGTVQCL
jgi:hypothetical protein